MLETRLSFKILCKLRKYTSIITRKSLVRSMRKRNKVSDISIISSNCIGGLFYHDLGLRFNSPNINLFMNSEDFIEYAENLEYYLSLPLTDVHMGEAYPIGLLKKKCGGNITLHFVHYENCEEAIEKWEARKKRVDFENLAFIFTDRDGLTRDILARYLKLPYKKVIYVGKKENIISEECVYIPGFEDNGHVPEMDKIADWEGHRFYEKYFDLVKWINS